VAGARDLADRLAQLSEIPALVSAQVASDITRLLRDEFDAGANAYGNPWKPLLPQTIQRKRGDARILRRTDQLSAQTIASAVTDGVEITSLDYGSFHQNGTSRMVARKILPDGSALPREWSRSIQIALSGAVEKAMK